MRPPVILVQIVHLQGPLKGEIQEFTDHSISIGRKPGSMVLFPADLAIVSRHHAEILREGNRFKLVDQSANGTFVNGKKVKGEIYLKSGDVLAFAEGGPKVSFLTQMKEDAPSEPSSPQTPAREFQPPQPREKIPEKVDPPPVRERRPPAPRPQDPEPDPAHAQPANVPFVLQYGPTIRSFKQLPLTIGKHPGCQLKVDHPALLDMHLQVFYLQNRYWVKDLTGKKLVLINGNPVGVQAPLEVNDVLSFTPEGPVFRFLGEGRLAEVEGPAPEQRGPADSEPRQDQEPPAKKSILQRFLDK